jgi:transcriptional regulator with XRE-family HTH domain
MAAGSTNTMLYWLTQAAKELREEADRKQVHIAATMSIDQSTIYRFEQGRAWPRQTDLVIAAYAEDLGIDDARAIWRRALEMWDAQGEAPTVADLMDAQSLRAAAEFEQAIDDAAPGSEKSSSPPSRKPSSRATRRRAG